MVAVDYEQGREIISLLVEIRNGIRFMVVRAGQFDHFAPEGEGGPPYAEHKSFIDKHVDQIMKGDIR